MSFLGSDDEVVYILVSIKIHVGKLDLSEKLRWYFDLFQANLVKLEVVWGKLVAISCLYLVYDSILHLLRAQW